MFRIYKLLPLKYLATIAGLLVLVITFSCKKESNPPEMNLVVFPSVGSVNTQMTIDATDCKDQEDSSSDLVIRIDWENDGVWDSDWTNEKIHTQSYPEQGEYTVRVDVKDTQGETATYNETLTITNSDHMVPAQSPFSYNVGINYDSWKEGRKRRNIYDDLDEIVKHFKLIKTYYGAGVGTTNVVIDPTMDSVINYVINHSSEELELVMGTNESSLAYNYYGDWKEGYMVKKTYTDEWVQVIINAFESKENVKKYLKAIMLGNEIDANGPADTSIHFNDYYESWIPKAFDNLKASLNEAGLQDIPVSTIIANYPSNQTANVVARKSTEYVTNNWASTWNSGIPFVLFNQYTADSGKSVDYGPVINYFESVDSELSGKPSVYVGETGYSEEFTLDNEIKVIDQIFSWLGSQHNKNKLTVPLFVFQAYDRPAKRHTQRKMGVFEDDGQNKPVGLKKGLVIPDWVSKKKGQ